MKRLYLISIIILSITNAFAQCNRIFVTELNYDNDFFNIHYENYRVANKFRIFHRTNEPVPPDSTTLDIKKPIIIIEGYDIFQYEDCLDIYRHYFNNQTNNYIGDNLRAQGYDIITYNLSKPMQAIEVNALVFADFIEFINKNKTGDEELIIIGVSMGGLISRYALTYMEQNNRQHQTKLFISFDSPQQGGYAPLSMQALIADPAIFLSSFYSPELAYLITCFKANGSQEMLTHSFAKIENGYPYPSIIHINFFNELNSMNNCGGYPVNCKRVGISNGSLNGETQKGRTYIGDYSGNPAISFGMYGFERHLRTVPGVDNWVLDKGQCIYKGIENCNDTHCFYIKKDGLPLDHVPGGYYPWFRQLYNQLNNINGLKITDYNNDVSCFVSTISALDLPTNDLLLDISNYSKSTILKNTPFDDIWWDTSHGNMAHTSYNFNLMNFVMDQIYLSQTENYAQENLLLSDGVVNVNDKKLYKAANELNVENYVIKNGGQLTLKSGNVIIINPGTYVEVGATVSAEIEKIYSRNCELNNDLPQFSSDNYTKYVNYNNDDDFNLPDLNDKDFIIYPNPVDNTLYISITLQSQSNCVVEIINPVTNQIIKKINTDIKQKGKNNIQINVSDLTEGFYIVTVQTKNTYFSNKFIKK